jgi:surfeit locus 1 family protein
MFRTLRQPKWIVATVLVVAAAVVFVRLGFWQLDRLEQRRATNALAKEHIEAAPVDLASILEEANGDPDALRFRRVVVRGTYDTNEEVLIRSQVHLGQAGFHVITPLVADDGWVVLVNRGWVPLSMDTPPVDARPDTGELLVEGWVQPTQTRPALGPEDFPGDQTVFNRIDVGRIGEQMDHSLASVYIVAMGEWDEALPVPVAVPDFEDEGPHLAYAIQWFGFAVVVLSGFYFLIRRASRRSI